MREGDRVRLRALRAEDVEHRLRRRNGPEVAPWATARGPCSGPVTAGALGIAFESMLRLVPLKGAVFTVAGQPIGLAELPGPRPVRRDGHPRRRDR
ncbi:hypothetical protein ACF9IK_21205 [Kitasatospora hibisci]|uniref:hypothetical protein n=1 Tax=Kitasatospora hibisci TaxID=3369522 RepID=UPI0037541C82